MVATAFEDKLIHPAAEKLRSMHTWEFNRLVEDIRAKGLIEPIILLDDQILDGRNRQNACKEAEVEPRYETWDGAGGTPEEYVTSVNVCQRHLSKAEQKEAAVRLHEEDPERSARSIAKETGLSDHTVAKAVEASKPTVESKKSNGLGEGAQNAHSAEKTEEEKSNNGRAKFKIAPGKTIEEMIREGIMLEDAGEQSTGISKKLGFHLTIYTRLRDLLLLHDNQALSPADRQIVSEAWDTVCETRQTVAPYKSVKKIAEKMWGGQKTPGMTRTQKEQQRSDEFDAAISSVLYTAAAAPQIKIPYLSAEKIKEVVADLKTARANIAKFQTLVKESHK